MLRNLLIGSLTVSFWDLQSKAHYKGSLLKSFYKNHLDHTVWTIIEIHWVNYTLTITFVNNQKRAWKEFLTKKLEVIKSVTYAFIGKVKWWKSSLKIIDNADLTFNLNLGAFLKGDRSFPKLHPWKSKSACCEAGYYPASRLGLLDSQTEQDNQKKTTQKVDATRMKLPNFKSLLPVDESPKAG